MKGNGLDELDPGIEYAVNILRKNGVETVQSCEGGPGHAFESPTVCFFGSQGAGWHALSVAYDHDLPVVTLQLRWDIDDGLPVDGATWEMVFRDSVRTCQSSSSEHTPYTVPDPPSPQPGSPGESVPLSGSHRRCGKPHDLYSCCLSDTPSPDLPDDPANPSQVAPIIPQIASTNSAISSQVQT